MMMHTAPPASRATLERVLSGHGLRLRGGWMPGTEDGLPGLPGGRSAAVVWMVGQVGSECWNVFAASSFYADGLPDPMDRWSKSIGYQLAQELGGVAVYPSDGPPYYPFQRWAQRAEPLRTSPLMLQIHPEFGLWHAYRFALVLPVLLETDRWEIGQITQHPAPDICLQCDGQPCLSACPVQAFTGAGYEVDRCSNHLHGPDAYACKSTGCLARHACPVGAAQRYTPQHAAFHMAAFANRRVSPV